jgi:altronate dehydratase
MSDVATQSAASVIRLHPNDNVVVAAARIPAGAEVSAEGVRSLEAIPFGHKIATRAIATGTPVLKYGQAIGVATRDIPAGAHVHVQKRRAISWASAAPTAGWACATMSGC